MRRKEWRFTEEACARGSPSKKGPDKKEWDRAEEAGNSDEQRLGNLESEDDRCVTGGLKLEDRGGGARASFGL